MKKKPFINPHVLILLAQSSAIFLMSIAFIGGTYVEQALLGMPDRVNFRQCLPWFLVFTVTSMGFNSVFDFSRRMHHTGFSLFISIIMVNVLMMALPFFEVLYYLNVSTLFIIIVMECAFMWGWLRLFHRLYIKSRPPLSTVVLCPDSERGEYIAAKINRNSNIYRADRVMTYDYDALSDMIEPFGAVVLAAPPLELKNEIALECWNRKKQLLVVPDIYELIINNATLSQFDDLMTYKAKSMGLNAPHRFIKRTFDIVASALALVAFSPLMLIVAVIVKKDGGPAFFSQERITLNSRPFKLYKFRTMIVDAEKLTGPTLAQKDDPRITAAGSFLRRTRLDELPQFFNVLKGDMSIVGPRPERRHFLDLYMESLPEYRYRAHVRAGITGLAHVLGKYSTTPEERIKLDLTYIQNYSLALDFKIILETFRVVFSREYAEGVEPAKATPLRQEA